MPQRLATEEVDLIHPRPHPRGTGVSAGVAEARAGNPGDRRTMASGAPWRA